MDRSSRRTRGATALALTLLAALASLPAGCRRAAQKGADGSAAMQTGSAQQGGEAASTDITKLGAEIERLEKQAERNPADEATRDELARAYVRRGNAERGGGQFAEALADYQRALRHDPDNDEAQAGAAAATEQLGGGEEGENGEPAPLPITPGVTDDAEKPTPTPKKQ